MVANHIDVTIVAIKITVHDTCSLKSTWDKMPTPKKDVIWQAGKWYDHNQAQVGYKKIPQEQYWPIIKDAGIEISHPLDEDQDAFLRQAQPIWEWWKKQINVSVGQKAIDLARGN